MKIDSDLIRKIRFGYGDTEQGKLVRCVFDLSRKTTYAVATCGRRCADPSPEGIWNCEIDRRRRFLPIRSRAFDLRQSRFLKQFNPLLWRSLSDTKGTDSLLMGSLRRLGDASARCGAAILLARRQCHCRQTRAQRRAGGYAAGSKFSAAVDCATAPSGDGSAPSSCDPDSPNDTSPGFVCSSLSHRPRSWRQSLRLLSRSPRGFRSATRETSAIRQRRKGLSLLHLCS